MILEAILAGAVAGAVAAITFIVIFILAGKFLGSALKWEGDLDTKPPVLTEADLKPGATPVEEVVKTLKAAAVGSVAVAPNEQLQAVSRPAVKTFEDIAREAAEAEAAQINGNK